MGCSLDLMDQLRLQREDSPSLFFCGRQAFTWDSIFVRLSRRRNSLPRWMGSLGREGRRLKYWQSNILTREARTDVRESTA